MHSDSHQGSAGAQSLGDFDRLFGFQRSVSPVAGEGLSVAVQRVFMLTELFDQVVSSAEREARNSFS